MTELLRCKNFSTYFPIYRGILQRAVSQVKAVEGVDLEIHQGEVVSLVGESGCGKSTLGLSLLGLVKPTSGELWIEGNPVEISSPKAWNTFQNSIQILFQDPYGSLNPRQTVFEIISEPLRVYGKYTDSELSTKVEELLEQVGLPPNIGNRYPHAFSGGQRQRINIARVLGLSPKLIICDEIVSALDVSVQAQIIKLLLELKKTYQLSLLFIAHDLSLVRAISDKIYVMYQGRVVEYGSSEDLFAIPKHPYTQVLLDCMPVFSTHHRPKLQIPEPNKTSPDQKGCSFASRCEYRKSVCFEKSPTLENSSVACFFPLSSTESSNHSIKLDEE